MADVFEHELETAVEAVRQATRLCRRVQSSLDPHVLEKPDRSPVTVADYGSQAVICRVLADRFPGDPIVGEEQAEALRDPGQAAFLDRVQAELTAVGIPASVADVCDWIDLGTGSPADRFWTVDPIDGTKGFLRGEQYAIAVALLVGCRVEVAVLGCPNLPVLPGEVDSGVGVLFTAVRGQGARWIPLDPNGDPHQLAVSDSIDPAIARLVESVESGHSAQDRSTVVAATLGLTRQAARIDSQAKYAVVARGEAEIYLRLPVGVTQYEEKIWDHAAGVLLVEEAGGRVSDLAGRTLDFSKGTTLRDNKGVVATNGGWHELVLEAIDDS